MATRTEEALAIAFEYGGFDGHHHKQWVIDQMVRALLGDPKRYESWVKEYEGDDEYTWEEGIPP